VKLRLLALVILLAWGLGGCLPAPPTPIPATVTATQTLIPSTTPVWFPATDTPTPPPLPTPRPTEQLRPGVGELLLRDEFDGSGWQTGQTEAGAIAFGKSTLTLSVSGAKASLLSLRAGVLPADLFLEMTITPSLCRGADAYGLLLRAASAKDFYRFLLNCDGQARLERVLQGQTSLMQDWAPAGSMLPGGLLPVRVGVWMVGKELRLFVDGEFVFSAQDPVLAEGQVGVYARSSADSPLTVSFSMLEVYTVDAAAIPSPTSRP
jgi:hypothetical protein